MNKQLSFSERVLGPVSWENYQYRIYDPDLRSYGKGIYWRLGAILVSLFRSYIKRFSPSITSDPAISFSLSFKASQQPVSALYVVFYLDNKECFIVYTDVDDCMESIIDCSDLSYPEIHEKVQDELEVVKKKVLEKYPTILNSFLD